jgi:hypothetical protein
VVPCAAATTLLSLLLLTASYIYGLNV